MTDPKPITVAEVERIGPEWAYYESVKAAARAAAEADSLRARLAKLEAWQVAVADGLGFLNRAEGQDGYEVAAPEAIIAACRKAEKVSRSYHSSLARKAAETALTVAQGEVAVLREALLTACSWAQCPIEEEGVKGEWVEDVKKIRAAFASTRATADAYRESEWRRAIVWWVNHGTINTTTDEALRALASTRATADAHDERVRREALKAAEADLRRIANEVQGAPVSGLYRAAEHLRALAHPDSGPRTDKRPLPPEVLANALQDRSAPTSGKLLSSTPVVKPSPNPEPKEPK